MVTAGFENVFIGIETPDVNTLASTQKQQNLREDIFENIKKIQTRGLEVYGGFIVGFDTDPPDIFDRQIDFIQKAGIPVAMIGLLTALPNTQLYKRLLSEGRLTGASKGNNTHDFEINFIPRMSKTKLMLGYKQIISEIYNPKNYFERCLTLLDRLPGKRLKNKEVSLTDLKAFILSIFKLGFSSYGLIYFKYLIKIIIRKKSLFPLAVNHAVKGYHFIRITEEILKAEEFSSMLESRLEGLKAEFAEIMQKGNVLIASKMEKYKVDLQYKTGKKYRQMSRDMQIYLTERLDKFENYCDLHIAQWKEKLHLQNKSEE
jgi:hypothetical protein